MLSAPILDNKDPNAASVFEPAALLREARRQQDRRALIDSNPAEQIHNDAGMRHCLAAGNATLH